MEFLETTGLGVEPEPFSSLGVETERACKRFSPSCHSIVGLGLDGEKITVIIFLMLVCDKVYIQYQYLLNVIIR